MNHFEQLVRTQLPTMAQVLQVVNRVSAEMVTRDDFKRQHDKFLDQIKPCPTLSRQTHKENTKPGLANPIANPNIYRSYISYSLPIGALEMYYDWEYNDSAKDSSSGSIYIAHARWKFQPVPWLSYKAFVTKASFLMRCGNELNRPILTPTLTASCFLSDKHPVWSMIKEGDLRGIRGLLDEGSISIRDTDTAGNTILHMVSALKSWAFADLRDI